jgi:ketosteroid isomerase-like protein
VAYHRQLVELGRYRIEITELIETGEEGVLANVQLRGEGTKSGAPVLGRYFALHTLRNGRVRRIQIFFDRDHALAAAGSDSFDPRAVTRAAPAA